MKNLKLITLTTLAFAIIASIVLVGCRKDEVKPIEVKKEKKTRFKKIFQYFGITVTVEGASGCLEETYYPNGQLQSR